MSKAEEECIRAIHASPFRVVIALTGGGSPAIAALLGVAARNAILLVDHYLHLMREEGEEFTPAMIIRAGQERMVPVLMTALTSGIGLVPLAMSPGEPGRELLYPVATVIIGGLISNTLLDFLVTPGLFFAFGREEAERVVAEAEPDEEINAGLKRALVRAGS